MVDRIKSRRVAVHPDRQRKPGSGGRREGAGRKKGSVNKLNLHAVREAKRRGMLPHELLHHWALTGKMALNGHKVDLDAKDVIDCAKAAAPYYGQKLAPKQVGDLPQVTRLEIDVGALRGLPLDQLQVFREVLLMLQKGIPGMSELSVPGRADPRRFEQSLRSDSPTEGRA